jgi:hypothetical protein
MMFLRCFYFIGILFLLAGCSNLPPVEEFVLQESYHLPTPVGTKANSWFQKFYEDGEDRKLYSLNDDKQRMYVYDIDKKSIENSFEFIKEGPGAPGTVLGFTVIEPNKIALSSGMRPYSIIIDEENRVLDTLNYRVSGDQEPTYLRMGARDFVDFAFGADKHFFIQRVFYRGIQNRPQRIEHHPIVIHDVDKGENRLHPFKFPNDYWEKGLNSKMTLNHDSDYVYLSMVASQDIYRFNRITEDVDTFRVKSLYAPESMPSQLGFTGPVDVMLYDASNVRYTAIFPDSYRNRIYRLVTLPPSDPSVSKQKYPQLHMYPDRFSLIICDENMNVLGEHTFPERTYFPHGIFISKDGIHIPATHPEYLVANGFEDSVRYDVFLPL